jgi:hypothetical protein
MNSSISKIAVVIVLLVMNTIVNSAAAPGTTRAQAISMVRSILKSNTASCRINKTLSVEASQVKTGWRVTARVVMAVSGTPRQETLVWTVASGQTVPASQIASEVSNGCP